MPSASLPERVSPYRVGAFFLAAALLATLVLVFDRPLTVEFVALAALILGFALASAFDAVRSHPLYALASTVETALLFGLLYVGVGGPFFLALACLALVGVAVELYNYRNRTSYLRFEA
ncbi:hypothetical protein NDI76_01800 [Halogeometricum sp. S1BR25-6]|uniref:Phosphatidate cytidylyltransferase n=1 Tax=Halogeometricum salsisoli TaxID=2950536 RepID=A0ABU2G9J7_9EURY|nr:hypothetical protein [Halogeometricum sp. S1BR25-6]MDS0297475.1 hypothetical protein [Halogeometricum sp. S1BR25-6]